jgi:LemA protein
MIATFIVLVAAAAFAGWYYLTYNSLVSYRIATEQAWSNVEVELKRRFDLIGNLVAVVKGYATHEKQTLEDITRLRGEADKAIDPVQAVQVQQQLTSTLTRLVAVAEAYPELKANEQYLGLQQELTETENRIAERRSAYNKTVNAYLNQCQIFPANVIASVHQFPEKKFFDAPDEAVAQVPNAAVN